MSRGLGRVQRGCLNAIEQAEAEGEMSTTLDIAREVYEVKADKSGVYLISDAQHVAVKRALAGLQRNGVVTGFRTQRARSGEDGRCELCHHWFTKTGLAKWKDKERRSRKRLEQ